MAHIAHLTSVHPRRDTRIFLKQCRSLAAAGYNVSLVVADGLGNEALDGVKVIDTGKPRGRRDRMLRATRRVLHSALDLNADLYHLHDPELLPIALTLKRRGKRVIFDSHEDVPAQILSKPYIIQGLRTPLAQGVAIFERLICSRLDAVIAATPKIRDKFVELRIECVDINNFPLMGELEAQATWSNKRNEVCYVGSIGASRGVRQIVGAMALCQSGARLGLGGTFYETDVRLEIEKTIGWSNVDYLGYLNRSEIGTLFGQSVAGLVTLLPTPAYVDSLPVKMFEYMAAGLPVIASDFPLWRDIVERNECGLCVDPYDTSAIANAIDRLVGDRELARRMGEAGRRSVEQQYNWDVEEKKLLGLYERVLSQT